MKVLIGCEESQAVCISFREAGHEAFSCDLKPCSGGHPEWHYQMDVFKAIGLQDYFSRIALTSPAPPNGRIKKGRTIKK